MDQQYYNQLQQQNIDPMLVQYEIKEEIGNLNQFDINNMNNNIINCVIIQ